MAKYMILALALFVLVACDAAGPGFRGGDKIVREVEGSRFTLRFRDGMAEAIRTSPEMLPRFDETARKAAIAVAAETGCKTEWVEGDPAMMLLGLSCNGEKAPKPPKRRNSFYCDLYDAGARRDGSAGASLECFKG